MGELGKGEKVVFYVEPGEVEVGIKGVWWSDGGDWQTLTTTLRAGETQMFLARIEETAWSWGLSGGRGVYIEAAP